MILRDPRNIPTRTAYPCVFAVGKWEILLGETPIRTCSLVFYPRGSYCREIYFGGDRAIPVGEAGASRARGPSETSEGTQPEVFPGSSIIDGTTMVIFVRSSPPRISPSLRSHPYMEIQASAVGCGSGRRSFWNPPAGSADFLDATGEIAKLEGVLVRVEGFPG